jgi:hypothetical protein
MSGAQQARVGRPTRAFPLTRARGAHTKATPYPALANVSTVVTPAHALVPATLGVAGVPVLDGVAEQPARPGRRAAPDRRAAPVHPAAPNHAHALLDGVAGDEPYAGAQAPQRHAAAQGDAGAGAGAGDDNVLHHGSCVPSGIIRSAAVVKSPGQQGLAAVSGYPAGVVSPLPSGKNDTRSGRFGLDRRSLCL